MVFARSGLRRIAAAYAQRTRHSKNQNVRRPIRFGGNGILQRRKALMYESLHHAALLLALRHFRLERKR